MLPQLTLFRHDAISQAKMKPPKFVQCLTHRRRRRVELNAAHSICEVGQKTGDVYCYCHKRLPTATYELTAKPPRNAEFTKSAHRLESRRKQSSQNLFRLGGLGPLSALLGGCFYLLRQNSFRHLPRMNIKCETTSLHRRIRFRKRLGFLKRRNLEDKYSSQGPVVAKGPCNN